MYFSSYNNTRRGLLPAMSMLQIQKPICYIIRKYFLSLQTNKYYH